MVSITIVIIQVVSILVLATMTAGTTEDCVQDINTARKIIDKPILTLNLKLQTAATTQNTLAVRTNCSGSACPGQESLGDLVTNAGYKWRSVGRLVAAGSKEYSGAVKLWLGSESNKKVLSDNFVDVGCSRLSCTTCEFPVYYTCIFATPAKTTHVNGDEISSEN